MDISLGESKDGTSKLHRNRVIIDPAKQSDLRKRQEVHGPDAITWSEFELGGR